MALQDLRAPTLGQALRPNVWDVVALILVVGAMVLIVYGGEQTVLPLSTLDVSPVSLDPANLPAYALRTTMRMLLAIICSIIFTFIYAALAAKSRRAEMVLIPLLDILQSVPILGFLTFTVVFFLNLFPGRVFGAELACVFAVDAQRSEGSGGSVPKFSSQRLAAFLAARCAVRDAGPDLEYDDVDVRRLVFRGGVGGNHRRQHHGHAAGHRLLRRTGHSKTESAGDRLRNSGDAPGYHRVRPVAVSPRGGLGRQIPVRADCFGECTDILDARPVPPYASLAGADIPVCSVEQSYLEFTYRPPKHPEGAEQKRPALAHRRRCLACGYHHGHRLRRLEDL